MSKDIFGICCKEYLKTKNNKISITVKSDIAESDIILVSYLFRSYKDMPELEKTALSLAKGNILDIGACAGSHSLYLQGLGKNVASMDISTGCCEVMIERGVKNVINEDIYKYNGKKYDSILLLMNGVGIAGDINNLYILLNKLKSILNTNGKIIFDSSDLIYLYMENDGSLNIPFTNKYYGQLEYQLKYNKLLSDKFNWLFIDRYNMEEISNNCGFKMEIITNGNHYDYLACLYN